MSRSLYSFALAACFHQTPQSHIRCRFDHTDPHLIPKASSKESTMTSAPSNQLPPGVSPNHPLGSLQELIDELRTHTQVTAENGQSDDLGVRTVITGSVTDALVPVFFRCAWPPGAKSRHLLIWMKPSIPNDALGTAINDAFRVIEAGGIIEKTVALWGGVNPFTDPSTNGIAARDTVRNAVGLDDLPTQRQIVKMMEGTMNGIMQVVVESGWDAVKCFVCRERRPVTQRGLDNIRKSAFKPAFFCEGCIQRLGRQEIDRIRAQAEAEAAQRSARSIV